MSTLSMNVKLKSAFLIISYRTDLDHPIGTVARRNQRERHRVRGINSTFRVLEAMLPSPRKFGLIKKPSKADILKNTIIYIERLQCLIAGCAPSTQQIKDIHRSTTPQKGQHITLPALESACHLPTINADSLKNASHQCQSFNKLPTSCAYNGVYGIPTAANSKDFEPTTADGIKWKTTPQNKNLDNQEPTDHIITPDHSSPYDDGTLSTMLSYVPLYHHQLDDFSSYLTDILS